MGDEGDPLVELFEEDVDLLDDALKSLELRRWDCVEEFVVEPRNDLESGGNGGELGRKMPAKSFGVCFLKLMRGSCLAIGVCSGAVVMRSTSFVFSMRSTSGFCCGRVYGFAGSE